MSPKGSREVHRVTKTGAYGINYSPGESITGTTLTRPVDF